MLGIAASVGRRSSAGASLRQLQLVERDRHGPDPVAQQRAEPERREEEVGDLLFASVCASRLLGVDADLALRKACGRFQRRFRHIEEQLGARLEDASLDEMEQAWQDAKASGLVASLIDKHGVTGKLSVAPPG